MDDNTMFPWADDPALFGVPSPDLVEQSWRTGRDTGLRCGGWEVKVIESSVKTARNYARVDREFGDRPGRAYWLAFARARRQIIAMMDRLPDPPLDT
jgi:hypothetical protein